jgi:hypothetical protein
LAHPISLYGSETWAVTSKDKSRLTAAEMRFMRKAAKYTRRDHKTNEEILSELQLQTKLQVIKMTGYNT